MLLIYFRSLVFNVVFYIVFALAMIIALPILFMGREPVFIFWHHFSKILSFTTRVFGGIRVEINGKEKLKRRAVIYAMRHESMWETLELVHFFDHPIFVMKKELFSIPIFGLMAKKSGAISIDREHGVQALTFALKQIKQRIAEGYPIVIFPEGTRRSTGVFSDLKRGISLFYRTANCPVIPVIHNSGKFWPVHSFVKYPGTIKLKIFPEIKPGLEQNEFMQILNETFRTGVRELSKE